MDHIGKCHFGRGRFFWGIIESDFSAKESLCKEYIFIENSFTLRNQIGRSFLVRLESKWDNLLFFSMSSHLTSPQ